MKTLKEELWSLRIYFKELSKEGIDDLKDVKGFKNIFFILIIIVGILFLIKNLDPINKELVVGFIIILLFIWRDYKKGWHIYKYREEQKKKIEKKIEEAKKISPENSEKDLYIKEKE